MNDTRTRGRALTSEPPRAQRRAAGSGRPGRTAAQVGPVLTVVLLLCTTITGALLYGAGLRDGALSTVHVVCALVLTISVIGHLVDRRKQLAGFVRRRHGKALRSLLADMALIAVLVASLVSGFAAKGSGSATGHMVVSLVLLAGCCVHGSRRMARSQRAAQRVLADTTPEHAVD